MFNRKKVKELESELEKMSATLMELQQKNRELHTQVDSLKDDLDWLRSGVVCPGCSGLLGEWPLEWGRGVEESLCPKHSSVLRSALTAAYCK